MLGLEGRINVWDKLQEDDLFLGSVGLYDPRWHPRVILRARQDKVNKGIPQDAIDYFVSFSNVVRP